MARRSHSIVEPEGPDYNRYKWFLASDEKVCVAEVICLDNHMAWRMLNNAVHNWDMDSLRLVHVEEHDGPVQWIFIDPTHVPKLPEVE